MRFLLKKTNTDFNSGYDQVTKDFEKLKDLYWFFCEFENTLNDSEILDITSRLLGKLSSRIILLTRVISMKKQFIYNVETNENTQKIREVLLQIDNLYSTHIKNFSGREVETFSTQKNICYTLCRKLDDIFEKYANTTKILVSKKTPKYDIKKAFLSNILKNLE